MGRNLQKLALWAVPLGFMAVLFYWPVVRLLGLGLQQDWWSALAEPRLQQVIAFTIGQALLSTLLCLAFGIPGAYLLYRKQFAGREFLRALIAVPFVLPTIVVAIAFSNFQLPALPAIFLAHLFLNYSVVVRTVGTVWQGIDSNLDDAAELDGASRWKSFRRVTLPVLTRAVASAATLVFLYCVTSFGIILLLGGGQISSIETEIYASITHFLDFKTAAALAIVQTLLTVFAFVLSSRFASNREVADAGNEVSFESKFDRRDIPVALVSIVFLAGVVITPIVTLLSKFSWNGLQLLSGLGSRSLLNISVWQAAGNSLRNLVIAGVIALVIGTLSARLIARSRRSWLEIPLLMPMGVSSMVLGFGYLLTIRAGWLATILVQATLAIPLVIRLVEPAIRGLSGSYRESASSEGASEWQVWWRIEVPLLTQTLRSAAVYAGLVSLGEFGSASLLSFGDQTTLPVVLYQLIARPGPENYSMAMAAAALLVVFVIAVSLTSGLVRTRRRSS